MKYNFQGIHILIVEDDLLSVKFLEAILEDSGAKIFIARKGEEAMNIVTNEKVDIVLMDIQLPGMDGNELTRKIKSYDKSIPVLAQTAHALEEDKKKSMEAGCDDYVTKPIDIELITHKIDELIFQFKKRDKKE